MLKSLKLHNFTVFRDEPFGFASGLNVFIGENGTGKSHLLKAAYCGVATLAERGWEDGLGKGRLSIALAEKFVGVFRPDSLGRLVWRAQGRGKCELQYRFSDRRLNMDFEFSRLAEREVKMLTMPSKPESRKPVYLPTRELLTIAPGFVSIFESTHLPFEETWRDTCLLLGKPLLRGPRAVQVTQMLKPIEEAMGGKVESDSAGKFYLRLNAGGQVEMHLVAEGLRKLAMIARLVATGALLDKGYLFWDEPETNLNPRIVKLVAKTILALAKSGIQVFVATHSLFLLRELHILGRQGESQAETRYFGLRSNEDGSVAVQQTGSLEAIDDLAALDEELTQSDRYLSLDFEEVGGTSE